ncbi:MAG TPA: hypothetical protein VN894_10950 [Polyangiaceae bacterium]|nr:hypothetical protein [Polyangiaceae bacterium]
MQLPYAIRKPIGGAALPLVLVFACKGAAFDPLDAAPSPQASAEPAPLANVPATATNIGADAGPPPEALRSDRPLATDVPRETARELGPKESVRDARELSGYTVQAVLRTGEGAPPPKAPEINLSAIEAARHKTEAHIAIDASQTRARFVLSGGFVLPQGAQLRARNDRYGHLVMWPGESSYRVAEPGALRALLGERRLDVAPLSPATIFARGEGTRRLNVRTRRVEISTRAAKAALELASFRDAGEGGVLVCRMLLDLMNAPPSTAACAADEMPLHADLRWTTQGALTFDVTSIARRADLVAQDLAAPPPATAFESSPLPEPPGETLVSRGELAAFRSAPVDVGPSSAPDAQPGAPDAGLLVVNSSDQLRVVWVDGVAVAWVAPGGRELLTSLLRGRYALQWRTFLGDAWEPPRMISVPGSSDIGGP